ncbi:MAG: ABC transporter permease [Candidatus Saccharibacteria bacterium]|nr:ABC transporter permease [Candidatus Saccharibacteria bacterium]
MALLLNTHFHLAVDNLRRNRGRTFLSALGIAIGVASIVLILSLTGGINQLISANSDKNNADLILVRPSTGKDVTENIISELTSNNQFIKSSLVLQDIDTISKIDGVASVAPIAASTGAIKIGDRTVQGVNIVATNTSFIDVISLHLKNGQFLDTTLRKNVAVLGYDIAMQQFGGTEAITKTFSYHDQHFMVIGVLDKIDDPINFNGIDIDQSILIDINHASSFESSIQIQQIDIRTATTDAVEKTTSEIKKKLSESKNGDQTFSVITSAEDIHPAGSLLSIVSSMLTLVASISLVVGGVGIMNIMLVSVSERTREIGIRKSVGASSGNILLQFLFESTILSVMGGILGFTLGYIGAFIISLLTPFAPHISWAILGITGGVSLFVGILFGIYPAIKAASKDPITSLKFYR